MYCPHFCVRWGLWWWPCSTTRLLAIVTQQLQASCPMVDTMVQIRDIWEYSRLCDIFALTLQLCLRHHIKRVRRRFIRRSIRHLKDGPTRNSIHQFKEGIKGLTISMRRLSGSLPSNLDGSFDFFPRAPNEHSDGLEWSIWVYLVWYDLWMVQNGHF